MERVLMALTAAICFCLGCQDKTNQIEFIIPLGFRGRIVIEPNHPNGSFLTKQSGRYIMMVPEDGKLYIRGYDPFQSYLIKARFTDGEGIWVSSRMGDRPQAGQIALWGSYTRICSDEFRDNSIVYEWFVGTEEGWNSIDTKRK